MREITINLQTGAPTKQRLLAIHLSANSFFFSEQRHFECKRIHKTYLFV